MSTAKLRFVWIKPPEHIVLQKELKQWYRCLGYLPSNWKTRPKIAVTCMALPGLINKIYRRFK